MRHEEPLLITGIALGPHGAALLTPAILDVLQPAVPVALAVLGVTSAFAFTEGKSRAHSGTSLAIAVGALAVSSLIADRQSLLPALALSLQGAAIVSLLAAAGWILSARGASTDERRVFSIATLLLLGGVADYLSLSGLLLGWIGATAWQLTRGSSGEDVHLDVAYVQHPITALLLIVAGASVVFSWQTVLIAFAVAAAIGIALLLVRRERLRLPITGAVLAVAIAIDLTRVDPRTVPALSVVILVAATLGLFTSRRGEMTA
jgi:hypothetical protein